MAYKLTWSPAARDDLRDIVTFISRDSPPRAETFAYRLIAESDKLQNFSVLPIWSAPAERSGDGALDSSQVEVGVR